VRVSHSLITRTILITLSCALYTDRRNRCTALFRLPSTILYYPYRLYATAVYGPPRTYTRVCVHMIIRYTRVNIALVLSPIRYLVLSACICCRRRRDVFSRSLNLVVGAIYNILAYKVDVFHLPCVCVCVCVYIRAV